MLNLPFLVHLIVALSLGASFIYLFKYNFKATPLIAGCVAYVISVCFGMAGFTIISKFQIIDLFLVYLLLAVLEEAARFSVIFCFGRKNYATRKWPTWPIFLAVLGFTMGWMEFIFNGFSYISQEVKCGQLVSPLSCEEGFLYLSLGGFIWPLAFHTFISVVGYAEANLKKIVSYRNILLVFCSSIIHTTFNLFATGGFLGQSNIMVYVVIPCLLLVMMFFAVKQYLKRISAASGIF